MDPNRAAQRTRSLTLCEKATESLKIGHAKKATSLAEAALQIDPSSVRPYSILCVVAMLEGRFREIGPLIDEGLNKTGEHSHELLLQSLKARTQLQWDNAQRLATDAYHQDPENDLIFVVLGDLMYLQEKFGLALPLYQSIIDGGWVSADLERRAVACLIDLDHYDDADNIRRAAVKYLRNPALESNRISNLVSKLLQDHYAHKIVDNLEDLKEAGSDELLKLSLSQMLLNDSDLEAFVISARRILLGTCLEHGTIPETFLGLICAIADQHWITEYIYLEDGDERATVENLANVIVATYQNEGSNLTEIMPLILLYAMYRPLYSLECFTEPDATRLEDWPSFFHLHAQRTLFEPSEESLIDLEIPSISIIEDQLSLKVQNQYEENPYPRWINIPQPHTHIDYHQNLANRFSDLIPKEYHPLLNIKSTLPIGASFEVLVAGCGTGQHPFRVAVKSPEISVIGVDLSRASLSYGKRMAKKFGVENIRFLQGDILNIHKIGKKFHAIETAGVLHHMEDPSAGLAALCSVLEPQGLLYMGLYSERARSTYAEVQNYIREQGIETNEKNIKALRGKIQKGELFAQSRYLKKCLDFQSMSGIRDLLFNVKEHRFTPLQIKELCSKHRLRFLGFWKVSHSTCRAYKEMFPNDPAMNSLDNWEIFEEHHPKTFIDMFHICCQAIP